MSRGGEPVIEDGVCPAGEPCRGPLTVSGLGCPPCRTCRAVGRCCVSHACTSSRPSSTTSGSPAAPGSSGTSHALPSTRGPQTDPQGVNLDRHLLVRSCQPVHLPHPVCARLPASPRNPTGTSSSPRSQQCTRLSLVLRAWGLPD